jgi:hypothetical protein
MSNPPPADLLKADRSKVFHPSTFDILRICGSLFKVIVLLYFPIPLTPET